MGKILQWNEKTLEVASNRIYTFSGWNTSSSFETEEQENGSDMPKSTAKAPGVGEVSFEVYLHSGLNIDVKTEYNWWRDQCNKGTSSLLYLGEEQFGEYKWRLSSVSMSDLVISGGGWKSCRLSLSFSEDWYKAQKTKLEKKAEKLAKKLEKQIKKTESAKNERALQKAAEKAAKLKKELEEAVIAAAEDKAAQLKKQAEAKKAAADAIAGYYSNL